MDKLKVIRGQGKEMKQERIDFYHLLILVELELKR
jgi:hypothetical protein